MIKAEDFIQAMDFEVLSPGRSVIWLPAGTVQQRPSHLTVTGVSRSISSSGREL